NEEANRERSREHLTTVPIDVDPIEENSSLKQGIVHIPTAVISTGSLEGSQPRSIDELSQGSTGGTFVAPPYQPPRKWPFAVAGVLGFMALSGAVLIGYSMRGRGVERVAAASTAAPIAPTVAVSALPELPTPVADL